MSVLLEESTDRGRTTLTVLVPRVRVRAGEQAPVHTFGITTVHTTGPGVAPGQLERSTITDLTGTATYVPA